MFVYRPTLAFYRIDSPGESEHFDSCLISGELLWFHILSTVMESKKNSSGISLNNFKNFFDDVIRYHFCSNGNKRGTYIPNNSRISFIIETSKHYQFLIVNNHIVDSFDRFECRSLNLLPGTFGFTRACANTMTFCLYFFSY